MISNLLKDKIAILTGGSGILGKQFANTLLQCGAKVAIFDIKEFENIEENNMLKYYCVDVTKKSSIKEGLDKVIDELGVPDILINNAGIDSPPSANSEANYRFEDVPEYIFRNTIDVNVIGVVLCCQVIGKAMMERGGSIINIGSIYGMLSPNNNIYKYKQTDSNQWYKPVAYSLSKSSLYNFTRYLATYWASNNIRVNIVSPSGVFNNQEHQFLEQYQKLVPMNRMSDASEVAYPIMFLASEYSSYITGQNIVIDGGYSAW